MDRCRSVLVAAALGLVALGATAAGHSIMWVLSARGVVHSVYGSYPHAAMFQTFLCVAVVAGVAAIVALGEALMSANRVAPDWCADVIHRIAAPPTVRTIVFVFIAQLFALYVLESIEQSAQFGHSLGIASVFGTPPIIGLLVHALCAIASTLSFVHACRAIEVARERLRAAVAPFARRLSAALTGTALPRLRKRIPIARRIAPLALCIANRPPPPIFAA